MFAQLRRAVARNATTQPLKRQFGGHHHHEETMSTHSELPPGDWRDRPMNWDFGRAPTGDYERFVLSHLTGPEDPALKLTQGQFIVYMRRLAREQFGYDMYTSYFYMAFGLFGFVVLTNKNYLNFHDVNKTTFAERQYSSIFDKPLLNGPNFEVSPHFRQRLDEFFGEHDADTIAKLPQDLQKLYNEKREDYNEKYASGPELIVLRENLSPAGITASRDALKVKFGLTDQDLKDVYESCDQYRLVQQAFGVDDETMSKEYPAFLPNKALV